MHSDDEKTLTEIKEDMAYFRAEKTVLNKLDGLKKIKKTRKQQKKLMKIEAIYHEHKDRYG